MATVAFDKHIGFCEAYIKEISKALYALIQHGGKQEPLDASRFFKIRQKWALWLTQEMENELDHFERRIVLIGGVAQVFGADGAPASNESSIRTIVSYLRKVLRTEELTALRDELVIRSSGKTRRVV